MSTEKEPLSFRVSQGTYEKFEDYQDRHQLTQSDAGRRLLARSLEGEGLVASLLRQMVSTFVAVAAAATVVFLASSQLGPTVPTALWLLAGVTTLAALAARRRPWTSSGGGSA